MKKYKNLIFSRIFLTALFILLQVFWIILFFLRIFEIYPYVTILIHVLSFVFMIYLINAEQEHMEYRIGWIVLVLIVPLFGVPFYLFCGDKRPSRKLSRKLRIAEMRYSSAYKQEDGILEELGIHDRRAMATANYIRNEQRFPVYRNSEVTYYKQGEDLFAGMMEAIRGAQHFIFMEYFTIELASVWQEILDALVEKAKQGVEVRLIYDDMGCVAYLPLGYHKYVESLDPHIKCVRFNKVVPFFSLVMNNRDHRKMLVVDGYKGFTGGINLSDRYINIDSPYGHWKDAGVRIRGEAVWSITLMFLQMWDVLRENDDWAHLKQYTPHAYHPGPFSGSGFVQPYGDEPLDDIPLSENAYIEIVNQAEKYLYIFTPYLILSDALAGCIAMAAKRGVDVRIVTPGIPDKKVVYRLTRANYKRLLRAGVRIYEYTPGFIHSKCMVSDDTKAIVGTVNLDYRSLFLHFEDAVFFYGNQAVLDLKKDALETFEKCREVGPADIKVSMLGGVVNSLLKVVAPLL